MAHRNEIGCFFRTHNAGNLRNLRRISFLICPPSMAAYNSSESAIVLLAIAVRLVGFLSEMSTIFGRPASFQWVNSLMMRLLFMLRPIRNIINICKCFLIRKWHLLHADMWKNGPHTFAFFLKCFFNNW